MDRPTVLVCQGKNCRRGKSAHEALVQAASEHAQVELVRCQKICKGPVVGVLIDERWEWFRRIRGPRSRRALVALLQGSELKKRLARRRARKRSGKRR